MSAHRTLRARLSKAWTALEYDGGQPTPGNYWPRVYLHDVAWLIKRLEEEKARVRSASARVRFLEGKAF